MQTVKNQIVAVAAIGAVTSIEIVALLHGINGTALAASCATLGAIVGYAFKANRKGKGV